MSLDPGRALKIYLTRTKNSSFSRSRLFVPIRQDKNDITAQTISSWIRSVIKEAYSWEAQTLDQTPKAHELRAIASSVAFLRNVSIADVIQAVGWRSQSTFGTFYLRDCQEWSSGIDELGAIRRHSTSQDHRNSFCFVVAPAAVPFLVLPEAGANFSFLRWQPF